MSGSDSHWRTAAGLLGGTIQDVGGEPYVGDVALQGDLLAALGDLGEATAPEELDRMRNLVR